MVSSLYAYLSNHQSEKNISFHMPGHKSSAIYKDFGYDGIIKDMLSYDITEIHGADNLFDAKGVIKEAEDSYAKLLGVLQTFFLVNGSSSGILASLLSIVKKRHKLILCRDCHKSVFNALYLGEIEPVFLYPSLIQGLGISSGYSIQSIEDAITSHPDADAVFIQNPSYYGVCSDLSAIERLVHQHGMTLIVDEAHGSHLPFCDALPLSATQTGADIIIQSAHKTLPALTQSSLLHVNSQRIDVQRLKYFLQVFQSSSPSYLLMTSLDITRDILESKGKNLMNKLIGDLDYFYNEVSKLTYIHIYKPSSNIFDFDKTKLNIYTDPSLLTGPELDKRLRESYHIYTELTGLHNVLALTSLATSREDLHALLKALQDIDHEITKKTVNQNKKQQPITQNLLFDCPIRKLSITETLNRPKKSMDLFHAEGQIASDMIIPYPPGIPLICPGEEITLSLIKRIDSLLDIGLSIIGIEDKKISVVD